jgi:nucleoside-diphosphate-sugar epimerase
MVIPSRQQPASPRAASQKRVLITGGSGFVGANLARQAIADGHELHLFLRSGHSPWRLRSVESQFIAHTVDLHDDARVVAALRDIRPHWVFHLATYGAYPHQDRFDAAFDTNVVAPVGLVRAAIDQGFESMVLAGTSSEYGPKDEPPLESASLNPTTAYGTTKAASNLICRHLASQAKVNLTVLRLYSIFGPYEEPTRLIPAFVRNSWTNRLPPLADPDIAHDFVFVEDAVDAFIKVAVASGQTPGAIYNVCSGVQLLSLKNI